MARRVRLVAASLRCLWRSGYRMLVLGLTELTAATRLGPTTGLPRKRSRPPARRLPGSGSELLFEPPMIPDCNDGIDHASGTWM